MNQETIILIITAVSIGFFHTLFGPDHYVPFVVMAKARKWSYRKTFWVTLLCGIGHVGSSVILGLIGAGLGLAVSSLEFFESARGEMAGWVLLTFGFVYFIWGVRRAIKNKPHVHVHLHSDGIAHTHKHAHTKEHAHVHEKPALACPVPWALFVIFVLGPCEPLIPLLMYPAAKHSFSAMILVAGVFSLVTISTMLGVVFLGAFGVNFLPLKRFERYSHAFAGLAIFFCGFAIKFLGL